MPAIGWAQLAMYLGTLLLLSWPLGLHVARVLSGRRTPLTPILAPLERACLRLAGVREGDEMTWTRYARALLLFNGLGLIALYLLQRFQNVLPLNPQHLGAVAPDLALNTAVSFATNTDWQSYGGETTMSYLTQMVGLTVQNFLSAATGIAALAALVRGFARRSAGTVGNFWVDLTRTTLHVLLPLSLLLAALLVAQGVVQTLGPPRVVPRLEPAPAGAPSETARQTLALGPVASQVAIKQIGTNGGGFFNVNSAHPFEDPTPVSEFLELLAILLLPAALCFTFGRMVGDMRQGRAIIAAMTLLFLLFAIPCALFEQAGNPRLAAAGADQRPGPGQAGGNMEGKELRFGILGSALWTTATTAASNGSVNAMHDSFTPLGGLVPMVLMQLGEVVYGGVGSGLYGMLLFAITAVFVAGLMVGRTPEYLGKKIEAFEMKMACLGILLPPLTVKLGAAVAVMAAAGRRGILNPGPHGFSEVLYALSSAGNNNGSAFAGLSANTPFYNLLLAAAMLVGRYGVAIPALAIAGSMARKRHVPSGAGTLPTHTPLFVLLLVGVVLIVGALAFLPALALGPVVEHLLMVRG